MDLTQPASVSKGTRLGSHWIVTGVLEPQAADAIYSVWDERSCSHVACKVMPSMADALRQANILTAMSHPSLVGCYGVEEPSLLFLAMVQGELLSEVTARAPRRHLALPHALYVALQLCGAIGHMHERGYVHLGLRPASVVLTGANCPVVCDFASVCRIGEPFHAPCVRDAYMAPEMEMAGARTGTAADVFSLAALLFEMLTGTLPYPHQRDHGTVVPSQREPVPLRQLRRSLPIALENLLAACLERDPEFRPEIKEVIELLSALIELPRDLPLEPRRPRSTRTRSVRVARDAVRVAALT